MRRIERVEKLPARGRCHALLPIVKIDRDQRKERIDLRRVRQHDQHADRKGADEQIEKPFAGEPETHLFKGCGKKAHDRDLCDAAGSVVGKDQVFRDPHAQGCREKEQPPAQDLFLSLKAAAPLEHINTQKPQKQGEIDVLIPPVEETLRGDQPIRKQRDVKWHFGDQPEEKQPLDEIIEKINEQYKGQFTDADKVLLTALRAKLMSDTKLRTMAKTSDPQIFAESIFPKAFGTAAQDSYMESQDTYTTLFEDQAKYNAIMHALGSIVYREMRMNA
mgnify:CR=1 FL=1